MRLSPDHICLVLTGIRRSLLFVAHAACFDTTKTHCGPRSKDGRGHTSGIDSAAPKLLREVLIAAMRYSAPRL